LESGPWFGSPTFSENDLKAKPAKPEAAITEKKSHIEAVARAL